MSNQDNFESLNNNLQNEMNNDENLNHHSNTENDGNEENNEFDGNEMEDDDENEFSDDDIVEGDEYEEGTTPSIYKYDLHQEPILKCAVTSNEENATLSAFYASQDDTASVMVFDTKNYMCLYTQQLQGYHDDSLIDIQLNFDKSLLATSGMDGTIGIYDISKLNTVTRTWKEEHENDVPLLVEHQVQLQGPESEVEWIRWHPKGNALLSAFSDGTCWLWNVKKMDCMSVLAGHSAAISCGGFTSDGKHVVTGSADATVRLWNPIRGTTIHTFEGDLFSQRNPIISMHIREESNFIYVGNEIGDIITCSIGDSPRILQRYTGGHNDTIESLDYSSFMPHILVSGSMDKYVGVWDDRVNKLRIKLGCEDGVIKVQCSKKAPVVYSCSMDGEVRIWDLRNGQCLDRLVGHTEGIFDFAISQDDDYVVTASDDSTSRIYETNLDMILQ